MSTNHEQKRRSSSVSVIMKIEDDMPLAVNAYLMAAKRAEEGITHAEKEKSQHLRTIQSRFWRNFFTILSANMAQHGSQIDLSDEERFFIDFGLVDIRMLGGSKETSAQELINELTYAGPQGCYYISEWLSHRHQQFLLEDSVAEVMENQIESGVSALVETRNRILNRLAGLFVGLPGIPLEVTDSMRTGKLDDAILNLSIALLQKHSRPLLLRQRNLWQLREQILSKAKARADSQGTVKFLEALNEVYAREWRERFETQQAQTIALSTVPAATELKSDATSSVDMILSGMVMLEARQMRMRLSLAAAANGTPKADIVLHSSAPRLNKKDVAAFIPVLQSFDRSFIELPPIVIVPGVGRGLFAWETGCILLSVRPSVGPEDSMATAFAFQRMYDDRFNRDRSLEKAYEKTFPGSKFSIEFPVDYRAWLCRLTHGDITAMTPERRAFFRESIGPDIHGPMLPSNLRNTGPQTLDAICRRLEKQITAGDKDFKLYRRLACLYWHQGNMEAANMQFSAAAQLNPNDGETLFTTAMFMRANDNAEGAATFFQYGAERAADTLWGVYCRDALANMF